MQEVKRQKIRMFYKVLFIAFLFNISVAKAQIGLHCDPLTTVLETSFDFKNFEVGFSSLQIKDLPISDPDNFNTQTQSLQAFPKVYNYHKLAFFCKVEVDIEKATKFPVKFRLGDVDYVDKLEGK